VSDPQPPTSRRSARDASQSAGGGQGGSPRPLPRLGLIIGAGALAFVLLGIGAVFAGVAVGKNTPASAVTPQPGATTPTRAVPADQVAPTAIPTCSLDSLSSSTSLMKFYGSVVETATGDSLYGVNNTTGDRPASLVKVLTASAAISALGPTAQLTTKVEDGVTPGTITLVGGGDPTLSAAAAGGSVYTGAPTMASLASQTLTAYNKAHPGVPITQIVLDSSLWNPSDDWQSGADQSLVAKGYLGFTTALQVDGDRKNPKAWISPRGTDPVMDAGKAFVTALGLDPSAVTLSTGEAENGAPTLASVSSQPISTLVKQMLLNNDDTLAESLARMVSVKENLGGGSSSVQQAMTTALGKYNLDTSDLSILDGSGESDESQVPPQFMSKFLALVQQKNNGLQYVAAGMPLVGKIYERSGALSSAYTLGGYLTAADGTGEAFTFYAIGQGITPSAKSTLSALASAVYKCGKNLTNN
jgi:serine-type D-Ala-D-Ala carboxypeptidase/endopeptidase (penicillin-binding protein 4)